MTLSPVDNCTKTRDLCPQLVTALFGICQGCCQCHDTLVNFLRFKLQHTALTGNHTRVGMGIDLCNGVCQHVIFGWTLHEFITPTKGLARAFQFSKYIFTIHCSSHSRSGSAATGASCSKSLICCSSSPAFVRAS